MPMKKPALSVHNKEEPRDSHGLILDISGERNTMGETVSATSAKQRTTPCNAETKAKQSGRVTI